VSTALLLAAAAKRNRSFSSRRRVMASTAPSLRDTQALQAKLDELLHAHNQANNASQKLTIRSLRISCGTGNKLAR
jgi:low affinity Fe/Cu permease